MKTRKKNKGGFWEGEECEYCHSSLEEKEGEVLRKTKDRYFIFTHVPVGVCDGCGFRYYTANTLKLISERLRTFKLSIREGKVSLINLLAA